MQILLVEDDKSIREILHSYLCDETQGRHCEATSNVREAIEMISKKRYDLIMLDLLLEGEIGTSVIQHARRTWQDDPPTICILSAMTGADKVAEANNVNWFIPKPFPFEIIDELIADQNMT